MLQRILLADWIWQVGSLKKGKNNNNNNLLKKLIMITNIIYNNNIYIYINLNPNFGRQFISGVPTLKHALFNLSVVDLRAIF